MFTILSWLSIFVNYILRALTIQKHFYTSVLFGFWKSNLYV